MKKELLCICLLSIAFIGFSQNKKEQIEELNLRIDSCRTVMSNQSSDIISKQIQISDLEQQLKTEQQKSQEKSKQITSLNKEIESLKNKIPAEANFKFKIINQVGNQDERYGTDSETELYVMIQNQLVDTYSEFGVPELDSSKTRINLSSEMSEKNYEIIAISSNKVLVKRIVFCSDCDKQESEIEKVYQKDVTGIWQYLSCYGDCDDERMVDNVPSNWAFAQPKYENVTIFFDPIHNQKTGSFLEPGEVFSAGEIKNGFMEVEYYYGGMQETGWVRVSDLEQASIPKTDEFEEE